VDRRFNDIISAILFPPVHLPLFSFSLNTSHTRGISSKLSSDSKANTLQTTTTSSTATTTPTEKRTQHSERVSPDWGERQVIKGRHRHVTGETITGQDALRFNPPTPTHTPSFSLPIIAPKHQSGLKEMPGPNIMGSSGDGNKINASNEPLLSAGPRRHINVRLVSRVNLSLSN